MLSFFWQDLAEYVAALSTLGKELILTYVEAGGISCIEILCTENKAGVWGHSHQPPEPNEGSGAELFTAFFQNIRIFRHSLV